ncbi:MAG TPA: DUF1003 domain-containing protein [Patescibacteria group bacterium]|nr:DUF1003 domain-containing protein [Patescibacteria group bacterium]
MSPTYHTKHQIYKVLEAKSLRKRSWSTTFADHLTAYSSTARFLFANIAIFVFWIVVNGGVIHGVKPFDPYPFGLLTMVVSLEAIILSVFVLISQNRAAQIATLREELHLRINQIAEQEITKCLELLLELREHAGITRVDMELEQMLKQINPEELERSIEKQLANADRSLVREMLGSTLFRSKK